MTEDEKKQLAIQINIAASAAIRMSEASKKIARLVPLDDEGKLPMEFTQYATGNFALQQALLNMTQLIGAMETETEH